MKTNFKSFYVKLLCITFLLSFGILQIKAQNSVYINGANIGNGSTTCDAFTVTGFLEFFGSNVGENAYVILRIDKRVVDINAIRPYLQFSDGVSPQGTGDASNYFETPFITDNYLGNPNMALYTVPLKNNIDLSSIGTGIYSVGYTAQLTTVGYFGDFSFEVEAIDNGGSIGPTTLPFTTEPAVTGGPTGTVIEGTCVSIISDQNQTPQGVSVNGNVLTNDETKSGTLTVTSATFNGSPLSIGSPTTVAGVGTLTINADGSYTFVPDPAFTGTVPPITYTASNGTSNGTANLDINVAPSTSIGTNNPPVANDDNVIAYASTTLTSTVLNNDYDPNGNTLTVTGVTGGTIGSPITVQGQQPIFDGTGNITGYETVTAGQLTLNANGTYSFVPAPGFFGTVNPVTYTVSDGNGGTDTAVLNITVKDNEKEVFAYDDTSVKPQGVTQTGSVKANDFNPDTTATSFNVTSASADGTPLTIGAATVIPGKGTLTLNADGTYTFVPLPTFVGNISVPYTICNNAAPQACDTATLNITSVAATPTVCYDDASIAPGVPTTHGITLLKRAGANNDNWPMVRTSAHTVLESNTKGFVITRVSTAGLSAITNPVEGMMVYDTTAKCLKIYDGTAWSCFSTPACP